MQDGVDMSLVEAAAERGCDLCEGDFYEGGRLTIRGDDVIAVLCRGCLDGDVDVVSRSLH